MRNHVQGARDKAAGRPPGANGAAGTDEVRSKRRRWSIEEKLRIACESLASGETIAAVARRHGVDYVNDSKATNVAAAVAAIHSVENQVVLIAGGDGKGGNFDEFASAIESKLAAAVLIGKDADSIAEAFNGRAPIRRAGNMDAAVAEAADLAESGETVLLAPACASLDQYANYGARGDAFIDAVRELPA